MKQRKGFREKRHNHSYKSEHRRNCFLGNGKVRHKEGPWRQDQGVSLGRAAAAHGSPGCESPGDLWREGETERRYAAKKRREGACVLNKQGMLGPFLRVLPVF